MNARAETGPAAAHARADTGPAAARARAAQARYEYEADAETGYDAPGSDAPGYDAPDPVRPAPTNGRSAYAYGGRSAQTAMEAPPRLDSKPRNFRAPPPVRPQPPRREIYGYPLDEHADYDEAAAHYETPRELYARRGRPIYNEPEAAEDYGDADPAPGATAPAEETELAYEQANYDPEYGPEYDEEAYPHEEAFEESFYDEAPERRRRRWLIIGTVVVSILVLGVTGVFAYRALFGVGIGDGEPRTIRPEAGPTKIVPGESTQTAEAAGGTRIIDRAGGTVAAGNERIVSREERPVEVTRADGTTAAPRVIPSTEQPQAADAAPAAAPPPAISSAEPRRVRTVTVRADGTIVPNPPAQQQAATAGAQAGATPPTPTSAQISSAPLALNPNAGPARQAAAPAAPQPTAPAQARENPWAEVSGQRQAPAAAAPAAADRLPQTQAAFPPPVAAPAPAPPPAPAVAVQTPPPAGSYVVQVASQKTQGEAQASWQALQQRYATILGGQQATIRRVNLGDRGVFFRAQVGPFGSRAQASELCQNLRAAGGECVIQRN